MVTPWISRSSCVLACSACCGGCCRPITQGGAANTRSTPFRLAIQGRSRLAPTIPARNLLKGGDWLSANDFLLSANKEYVFIVQTDGNCCIYRVVNGKHVFQKSIGIFKGPDSRLTLREDGFLIASVSGRIDKTWYSGSSSFAHALVLGNNGRLVVVGFDPANNQCDAWVYITDPKYNVIPNPETNVPKILNHVTWRGLTRPADPTGSMMWRGDEGLAFPRRLNSANGQCQLNQNGKDFQLIFNDVQMWHSDTNPHPETGSRTRMFMQYDGNVIVTETTGYSNPPVRTIWDAGSQPKPEDGVPDNLDFALMVCNTGMLIVLGFDMYTYLPMYACIVGPDSGYAFTTVESVDFLTTLQDWVGEGSVRW